MSTVLPHLGQCISRGSLRSNCHLNIKIEAELARTHARCPNVESTRMIRFSLLIWSAGNRWHVNAPIERITDAVAGWSIPEMYGAVHRLMRILEATFPKTNRLRPRTCREQSEERSRICFENHIHGRKSQMV